MDAAWAQVIVSGLVGFTQCGLITVGLWQMRITSNERNRQLDRQDKVMEQQGKALEQQITMSQQQGKALETAGQSSGTTDYNAATTRYGHGATGQSIGATGQSAGECQPRDSGAAEAQCLAHAESVGGMHAVFLSVYPGMQTRYLFVGLFTGRPAPATALECRPR